MPGSLECGVIGVMGPPAGVEGPRADPNMAPAPTCDPPPIAGDMRFCGKSEGVKSYKSSSIFVSLTFLMNLDVQYSNPLPTVSYQAIFTKYTLIKIKQSVKNVKKYSTANLQVCGAA